MKRPPSPAPVQSPLLRVPGVLDALLFWSIFTSSTILMLWLLTSTLKDMLRGAVVGNLYALTNVAADAVGGLMEPGRPPDPKLAQRLGALVEANDDLLAVAVVRQDGSGHAVVAEAGVDVARLGEGDPRITQLVRQGASSIFPVFSGWEFILEGRLPVFTEYVTKPEYSARRLHLDRDGDSGAVLLLVFDAPRIQERFLRVDWVAASVISVSIILGTVFALLVRRRSMQRDEAERRREEAYELLRRRDAILAAVAASADDMVRIKEAETATAVLIDRIRTVLEAAQVYVCLAAVSGKPPHDSPTALVIGLGGGHPPLGWEDLAHPAFAGWRSLLSQSQALHGPLEEIGETARRELQARGIVNFALAPVIHEAALVGILVVLDRRADRAWEPGLLDTLRLAADLIGAAFGRQQQEKRLMETGKMEALGRVAGGVAHEFNNLLHIIAGNLRRIEDHGGSAGALGKIIETTERGRRIVGQLLSATRQSTPVFSLVSLNDLIEKTLYLARPAIRRNIEVTSLLAPDLPLVEVDAEQIQQVLLNLLLNAQDAIPGAGAITVATGYDVAADAVCCSVEDTGTGIDPEAAERLFEPFFTTKPPGQGTGLGLSTSRGILQQHRGSLTVAPRHGGSGAVFTFSLPCAPSPTPVPPAAAPDSGRIPVPSGRVLVADDEPLCLELLKDTLEEGGFDCVAVRDGTEALRAARAPGAAFEWVVTDWTMPGIHGRELARALREAQPGARILVTSGFALQAGDMPEVDGLVPKPFSARDLLRKMAEVEQVAAG